MAVVPAAAQTPEFDDRTSSDIVVKFLSDEGDGTPAVLHCHQPFLVEQSTFFAAQLSDRWTAACTERDQQNRPVYTLKGCHDPNAFAGAVEKLYKMARCGSREDRPGEAFSSFEDAVRCLVPADRLGLVVVYRAAVRYLESVAWTSPEKKAAMLALIESHSENPAVKGLVNRLAPPTHDQQAELWDELLKKACPLLHPQSLGNDLVIRDKAREFISTSLRSLSKPTLGASGLLDAIRRRLCQLKDEVSPLLFPPRNSDVISKVCGLMSSLEWVLRLSAEGADVRADVAELQTSLDASIYVEASNTYGLELGGIANCVRLLEAVAEGVLVLDLETRVRLLEDRHSLGLP